MNESNNFIVSEKRVAMQRVFDDYRRKRGRALHDQGLDYDEYRQRLSEIKTGAINNIKALQEKAIGVLKDNGINVFLAKDSQEAREIINRLLMNKEKIVKAKSNVFNEIKINGFLSDKQVTETDLGDFIVEMAGESGVHPVLPAIHLSAETIARTIKDKTGREISPDPESIISYARDIIRTKIMEAEAAITGANVITADGRIVLLENEGNISLISRIPKTHIILSGFEKIVHDLSEAMNIVRASAIWGTGQSFPSYVSIISGPSKTADVENKLITGAQGAKEVNLILIDNGRSKLIEKGLADLLHCLNCGACLNFCPVFHQIGQKYGDRYLGSRGIIFAAFSEGFVRAKEANCFACTLCSACYENCPMKINLPELIKKVRGYLNQENIETSANREMIEKIRKFGNPFGATKKGEVPDQLYCC